MLNGVAPSPKTFAGVAPWFQEGDISTANVEIPLTASRTATSRKTTAELRARQQYILKADPDNTPYLAETGFDLVGLANNHSSDYGSAGIREMTTRLTKAGVEWCGAGMNAGEASAPKVVTTKNGVKVAFVAFLAFRTEGGLWKCTPATDTSFGVATIANAKAGADPPTKSRMRKIKAIVANARAGADVVVVWLHWGTERRTVPDPFQVQLGRAFVEAGADCVLGSHPHVLQGGEIYAGRPIFYSLGNLVSPLPATTAVFGLTFEGRKFVKTRMLPCRIGSGRVEPIRAADRAAAKSAFHKLGLAVTSKFKNSRSKAMAPG